MSYKLTYYNSSKNNNKKISSDDNSKYYRKSVPKALKDRLWDITYGPEAGQGECYVCGTIINSKKFEAGHIISVFHGGKTTLHNLKCICSTCNKSMSTQNLEDFKKTYFPAIAYSIKHKKCKCCCHENSNQIINHDLKAYTTKTIKSIHKDINNDIDENDLEYNQLNVLSMLDKFKYTPKEEDEY